MGRNKTSDETKQIQEYWNDMEGVWKLAAKQNHLASINSYKCPYCIKFYKPKPKKLENRCGKCPLFKKIHGKDQRWCDAKMTSKTLTFEYAWTEDDTKEKQAVAKKIYKKILKDREKYFPEV